MRRRELLIGIGLLLSGCTTVALPAANRFHSDRITVSVVGAGEDVILVPGLGSSTEVWDSTVRALPGYRYHLVQVAGFAGTPVGGNNRGPLVASTASEIARYIREANLKRPAIIGHSMGGTVAMSVAARHDLVSKVMVVDMLPFLGIVFGPPGTTAQSVRATADALRDQSLSASSEDRQRTVEAGLSTMIMNPAHRAAPTRHALTSDRTITANAFHEVIVTDLRRELQQVKVPITVLYVKTPTLPLSEEQFDALYQSSYASAPRVRLKRIPNSYHFIMYDQPDRFVDEVRAFLRSRD